MISSTLIMADTEKSTTELNIKGQTILETISNLEKEGYITKKNASQAKKEFVFDNKNLLKEIKEIKNIKETAEADITWTEYLSLINIIKILAIMGFLFVFRGVLLTFVYIFKKVPVIIYQLIFMIASLTLTFNSEVIWKSQSFYLSNLGVIMTFMVFIWIVSTYEEFFEKITRLFRLNMPISVIAGFYTMVYFGFFAIYFESSFLGLLSVIGFSAMFSFILGSIGLTTYIGYDDENYMNISIIVNGLILLGYSFITVNNVPVPYIEYFSIGIEYVCSLAFIVALLINSSFVNGNKSGFSLSVLLMFVSFGLSLTGIYLFNMSVIPVIINTGFFLFMLSWIGYFSLRIGNLISIFIMSSILYGVALLIESRPEMFVTALF